MARGVAGRSRPSGTRMRVSIPVKGGAPLWNGLATAKEEGGEHPAPCWSTIQREDRKAVRNPARTELEVRANSTRVGNTQGEEIVGVDVRRRVTWMVIPGGSLPATVYDSTAPVSCSTIRNLWTRPVSRAKVPTPLRGAGRGT